jgi:hypothetical protein
MSNPYEGDSSSNGLPGIKGVNSAGGTGVWGESDNKVQSQTWIGVYGLSSSTTGGAGVYGENKIGPGVIGISRGNGTGVYGESQQFEGVRGVSHNPNHGGVVGICDKANGIGVYGFCDDGSAKLPGTGVFGKSSEGEGVHGESNNSANLAAIAGFMINPQGTGPGVYGRTDGRGAAIIGQCTSSFESNDGVLGVCSLGGNAIHGKGGTFAGFFEGTVQITGGSLSVTKVGNIGGEISATSIFANNKQFRIDHPLDPANKYLLHATIESSEMMNIYSGVALLDCEGEAEVILPEWFEALNCNFRYQLTCIGGFAPVYIAAKILNNRFKIAGGFPDLEVSWQVVGCRQDRWALENPLVVVVEKPMRERLRYDEEDILRRRSPIDAADRRMTIEP